MGESTFIVQILLQQSIQQSLPIFYWGHPLFPVPDAVHTKVPAAIATSQNFFLIWQDKKSSLGKAISLFEAKVVRSHRVPSLLLPRDKVWLSPKYICLKTPSYKLILQFLGPYSVIKQQNPVCYKPHIPASIQISNYFHVPLLKHQVMNHFSRKPPSVSEPTHGLDAKCEA